ncbi:hypothetical protein BLNAU_17958 [Blattamonas nauphoetae]|uniref:Uncharacterized protein n=1 Tax=Blattamonas nauphoetae TaxID=2049346 RepID=A0ABQ9X5Q7_9EUKA|nr:hypothetical protein BLNAU_17958 [Blattamonas nauphoetae]
MTTSSAYASSSTDSPDRDCSASLVNWRRSKRFSDDEIAVVFRSLVATVKLQAALDVSLEAKAVKFLDSVIPENHKSSVTFVRSFGRMIDESSTHFVQSIVVLLSSASQVITVSAMKMLRELIIYCSSKVRLALVTADLVSQLMNTLNPQSLPFTERVDFHMYVMEIINRFLWLATPGAQANLEIEGDNAQQGVYETVLKQVIVPSEKYIRHLCVNRFSIVDGELSWYFLTLLARLLGISPYYQPTMDVVVSMPVFLTIPSCLTYFVKDHSIWCFLVLMNKTQREWNATQGDVRQMWKKIYRMLRMEGMEDAIEEKLRNDQVRSKGRWTVANTIILNNVQGMNLPKPEL